MKWQELSLWKRYAIVIFFTFVSAYIIAQIGNALFPNGI